jgi:hypothetical protein
MAEEKVIITIDSTNFTTHIEAEGFSGGSCLEATAPFEAALGKPGDRKLKKEFHQVNRHKASSKLKHERGR